jgi:glycosyltransferase involved in cell wall biosynthesis
MRVLHVPYSYFPDPAAGTEIYVDGLAVFQRSLGCDVGVAAPGSATTTYNHSGIPVWRFAVSPNLNLRDLYGEGDSTAAELFGRALDDFGPDIVHLHAMTSAISDRLARQAASRHIPIILNYPTPTVSCPRGTLLRWGSTICDGKLDRRTCTGCTLQRYGLPRPLAKIFASLPVHASRCFGNANLSGGKWTALRMPELVDLRIGTFHRLMEIVERVIALCDWTRELLIRNGVPENRITLCRQGISWQQNESCVQTPQPFRLPVKAAFFGRLDETKGIDLVVHALKGNPELPIRLDMFGVRQGEAANRYAAELQELIAGDDRIRMLVPLPSVEVIRRIRDYDLVVVPSQSLETGPLVVLEAFAAGVPVLGSNLGGIAELVTDGVDGILVDAAASPAAWADSLRRVCSDSVLLASLRSRIRPPRQTRDAALELMPLYNDVVQKRAAI